MIAQQGTERSMLLLACGNAFDGISYVLTGPAEILVEGKPDYKGRTVDVHIGR